MYLSIGGFIAGWEIQDQVGGKPGGSPLLVALTIFIWWTLGPAIYVLVGTWNFLGWVFKKIDYKDVIRFLWKIHFQKKRYAGWAVSTLGYYNWTVGNEYKSNSLYDRLARWGIAKINKLNNYTFDREDWEKNGQKF